MGVTLKRKGYTGPVTVTVANPPVGLTVRPGTIAGGQTVGVLSFSATADARFPAAPIKLVAHGDGSNGTGDRLASNAGRFRPSDESTHQHDDQYGLVVAPALATPVTLDVPSAPIEVAQGFGATIPVKLVRTKGADEALAITATRRARRRDDPRRPDRRESDRRDRAGAGGPRSGPRDDDASPCRPRGKSATSIGRSPSPP